MTNPVSVRHPHMLRAQACFVSQFLPLGLVGIICYQYCYCKVHDINVSDQDSSKSDLGSTILASGGYVSNLRESRGMTGARLNMGTWRLESPNIYVVVLRESLVPSCPHNGS